MEKTMREALGVSKEQVLLLIKGIILGMGMIIPGISGGTIIMAFGMYEKLLDDLLKINIIPYIAMGIGGIIGIFTGSNLFSYLFEFYRNPTSAFILGCLLMSVPFILKKTKKHTRKDIFLFFTGGVLAFILMDMPTLIEGASVSIPQVFLAGFISSSALMIPGISGSAVLIILGIYEEILLIINELQVFKLLVFGLGAILGVLILAKILKSLFAARESEILFFFSGLILGSSRILLPSHLELISIITFVIGASIVYKWGNYKYKKENKFLVRTYNNIRKRLNK